MYPTALLVFGLLGNAYIVEGRIKEVKDDLKVLKNNIKGLKTSVDGLVARQDNMDQIDMSMAARIVKGCGEKS